MVFHVTCHIKDRYSSNLEGSLSMKIAPVSNYHSLKISNENKNKTKDKETAKKATRNTKPKTKSTNKQNANRSKINKTTTKIKHQKQTTRNNHL